MAAPYDPASCESDDLESLAMGGGAEGLTRRCALSWVVGPRASHEGGRAMGGGAEGLTRRWADVPYALLKNSDMSVA